MKNITNTNAIAKKSKRKGSENESIKNGALRVSGIVEQSKSFRKSFSLFIFSPILH